MYLLICFNNIIILLIMTSLFSCHEHIIAASIIKKIRLFCCTTAAPVSFPEQREIKQKAARNDAGRP